MPARVRYVVASLLVGGLPLGGCMSVQTQQQQALTQNNEPVPAAFRALSWGAGPRVAVFVDAETSDHPRLRIERQAGVDGHWTVRRYRVNGAESGAQALTQPGTLMIQEDLAATPEGGVVLVRQFNHAENVEVVFDPPMLVLPPLASGEAGPWTQTLTMRVYPADDPEHVRTQGPAKSTLEAHAGGPQQVAGRTVESVRIDNTLTASLGPAQVRSHTTLWYGLELGLVTEDDAETTTVLLPIRQRHEHWVLEAVGNEPEK